MFGKFFKEIMGRPISDFETLTDIEVAVAKANGAERLDVVSFESNLINHRGNVFSYTNDVDDLDRKIDDFLVSRS